MGKTQIYRTPREQLDKRQSRGTSPFQQEGGLAAVDTSPQARARCEACGAEFVNVQGKPPGHWLDEHIEMRHAAFSISPHAGTAEAICHVREVLSARIKDGDLKAGQVIKKAQLARQMGASRYVVDEAVAELIAAGELAGGGYYQPVTVAGL